MRKGRSARLYKPYGAIKSTDGIQPDFQYAGPMWVPEVGLNASATRFFDPGTTRWMTADWIGELGGINRYGYVNGRPTMGRIREDWKFKSSTKL